MKEILIHPKHKAQLAKEFGVSQQTVNMTLKYVYNSDKSKLIRSRAKELLIEESKSIEETELKIEAYV